MTYRVLTDESADNSPLPVSPSSIWVISTLEIAIKQAGKSYMLLTFPSYAIQEQPVTDSHDEGYWAPPFVAYPVPFEYSAPSTVGSLRRLISGRLNGLDLHDGLHHLAYQMGLRDIELESRQPFLELKVSPRSPGLVKAYYIVRHGLIRADESSLRNLADPEVRRGYVYLPIAGTANFLNVRYSETHLRNEDWFLGKPLMSNVQHLLSDEIRRLAIEARAFELSSKMFARREHGVICVVDLSGYGAALRYAKDNMHTFSTTPSQIQEELRQEVAERFQELLGRLGASQIQVAGDGFVAAFPNRVFPSIVETVQRFVAGWLEIVDRLKRLNSVVRDLSQRVGSRVIIHVGDYRFGRIGGVKSFSPAFDGESIIEAVRMEQGLGALTRAIGPGDDPSGAERRHYLGVSKTIHDAISSREMHGDVDSWEPLGVRRLSAKEFEGEAWVYRLPG